MTLLEQFWLSGLACVFLCEYVCFLCFTFYEYIMIAFSSVVQEFSRCICSSYMCPKRWLIAHPASRVTGTAVQSHSERRQRPRLRPSGRGGGGGCGCGRGGGPSSCGLGGGGGGLGGGLAAAVAASAGAWRRL